MVGVKCVNRKLNENGTRSSRLGDDQGLPDRWHNLSDSPDGGTELAQWLK